MEYLDAVFNLWLYMLEGLVADNRLGAIFWVFILVMSILIFYKLWKGVATWTGC